MTVAVPGSYTHRELFSQPDAWRSALDRLRREAGALRAFYREGRFDAVQFTGCGSTYYAGLAAAATFEEMLGLPARALPGSELWLRASTLPRPGSPRGRTLLVAISRSGETTETLRAVDAFRAGAPGDVLTLSGYPDRPLATCGSLNLVFPEAQEDSVAQTRAFSTLYLAAVALAALWAGRDDLLDQLERLPAIARRLLDEHAGRARDLGRDADLDRFYFLGSGPRYGLASELSLKMKEMSLSHSEPFHVLEFRHGPQSMVTPGTLIVALLSEGQGGPERAVLAGLRARGARVLAMAEHDADVAFGSGLDEVARNVLYLPVGQCLAYERALGRGLDPDAPHNLTAVVKL